MAVSDSMRGTFIMLEMIVSCHSPSIRSQNLRAEEFREWSDPVVTWDQDPGKYRTAKKGAKPSVADQMLQGQVLHVDHCDYTKYS